MKNDTQTLLLLLGWTALIQLLTSLMGVVMLFLTFNPLGGGGGVTVFGMLFLAIWVVWGYFLPRRIRISGVQIVAVLLAWSLRFLALWLALEDRLIVFNLPQMLAGTWLAELWPGSHYSAWYQQSFEPAMIRAAHFLLPAVMGLGLWLRGREECVNDDGKGK